MSSEIVGLVPQNTSPKASMLHLVKNEDASVWLTAAAASFFANKLDVQTSGKVRKTSILRQTAPIFNDPQSPPSPTEKKNVRFADTIGLQLESIKYFGGSPQPSRRHSTGTLPKKSNLNLSNHNTFPVRVSNDKKRHALVPINFSVPSLQVDFCSNLEYKSVLLNLLTMSETTIYGIVLVKNYSFSKQVFIRYTTNDWGTYKEIGCNYLMSSQGDHSDKFNFTLYIEPSTFANCASSRLFFAIRYETNGEVYWDNNGGKDYCLNYYQF